MSTFRPLVVDLSYGVQVTARETGHDQLPRTLVAVGPDGDVWGAVALGRVDDGLSDGERADREPWLLGLVVDAAHRRRQVGRLLVSEIERVAARHGFEQLWVATGPPADAFYRRCGWVDAEAIRLSPSGDLAMILHKPLPTSGPPLDRRSGALRL